MWDVDVAKMETKKKKKEKRQSVDDQTVQLTPHIFFSFFSTGSLYIGDMNQYEGRV